MISYLDTSSLLKLLVTDEPGTAAVGRLWLSSTAVVCCQLGYVEARAALAAAHRARRLTRPALRDATQGLEDLWSQLDTVPVTELLVRRAGQLAEDAALRGYDAVHLAAALTVPADAFATSDVRLARAAEGRGLHVLQPT